MGLIKFLQRKYENDAEEDAEFSARWEERNQWMKGSPRVAYKKGFKEAYSRFRNVTGTIISIIGFTIAGYLFVEKDFKYLSQLNFQALENQAKQQRVVDFYHKHGNIPEGVSSAYLDLRSQLWQREVEGGSS